jgi:glycine/D-amino acid oxidase-like deaminating enzyme
LEKSSNQKIYTDILIIGGGVIGGASAYYLSKKGLKVTILEKSGIATGASGSCDGFLFLQSKKDRDIISLTKLSLKSFPNLSNELSYDIEYENCGGLVVFSEHYSREEIESFYDSQKDLGIKTRIIERDELHRFEPFISDKIKSATYCTDEGQVNPIALNYGFCKAAKNNGALVITHQAAVSFETRVSKNDIPGLLYTSPGAAADSNNKVDNDNGDNNEGNGNVNPATVAGIETCDSNNKDKNNTVENSPTNSSNIYKEIKKVITSSGTEIYACEVIICAGAYSGEVGNMLGVDIPVKPRRGSLAVTEALPRTINHAILDYDYICCKFDQNRETGFTIEQTKQGNLLIGSIREFEGFKNTFDNLKIAQILKRSVEIFPLLSEVSIIRIFSGFRPYSEDFKPLIGPVNGFSNLWIASGHEGDGIALSCATGKLITALVESKILRRDFINIETGKNEQRASRPDISIINKSKLPGNDTKSLNDTIPNGFIASGCLDEFAGININGFLPSKFNFYKKPQML